MRTSEAKLRLYSSSSFDGLSECNHRLNSLPPCEGLSECKAAKKGSLSSAVGQAAFWGRSTMHPGSAAALKSAAWWGVENLAMMPFMSAVIMFHGSLASITYCCITPLYGTSAVELLAAVQQMAGPKSPLSVAEKAAQAVNIFKVIQALEAVADVLRLLGTLDIATPEVQPERSVFMPLISTSPACLRPSSICSLILIRSQHCLMLEGLPNSYHPSIQPFTWPLLNDSFTLWCFSRFDDWGISGCWI
eukprot:1158698-Pelagomonas_calceolata.AAC.4